MDVGDKVVLQPRYPENYGFAARSLIGLVGEVVGPEGRLQPGDTRVPIRYLGGAEYLADPRDVKPAS